MRIALICICFLSIFGSALIVPVHGQSVEEDLDYINKQFARFRKMHIYFELDSSDYQLVWRHNRGINTVDLRDVFFLPDLRNGFIKIRCMTYDKCIKHRNRGGSTFLFKDFSIPIKERNMLIVNAKAILEKFNSIKTKTLADLE